MNRAGRKGSGHHQKKITRRKFLKSTGAAALVVSCSEGLDLLGRRGPAVAQERVLHVLAWKHFIRESDALIRNELIPEFKRATGIQVTYETIDANDLNARAVAAFETGSGPDIFQLLFNEPHLYAEHLTNLDELAADLGVERQYDHLREAAKADGVLRGIPYYMTGTANAYRKDIFEKLNIGQTPATWDDYLRIGAKLKDFGMPVGQTLGHTFADAQMFTYPLLWSFGGQEVDENGKVAINSRATVLACEFLREFWHSACDEGGLAWDGASNNRAFFAGTIGATFNAASIYLVARYNPEQVPPGMADKIGHFLNPQGPKGRFQMTMPLIYSIPKYSRNKESAREYIRFLMESSNYERYILSQKGYGLGATPDWENHPFWKADPPLEPFRMNAKFGRNFGWPGPYNRKASEAHAKYIITDLFARVAKGDSPESSIAQAEWELKKVYEQA